MRGTILEDLTWLRAEKVLTRDAVVVVPIGAASKEHGPHLLLKNDWLIAEYLKTRLVDARDVVVAPTVGFHFYPAFAEYPGSISLRLETARDVMIDICESLARFGPHRFYALNTGVSTERALAPARDALAERGITLRYTELRTRLHDVSRDVAEQTHGTHADEIETSMMLVIAPSTVDMARAAKDGMVSNAGGGLTRVQGGPGVYSPTGVFGDATLATREKGERVIAALMQGIFADVDALRAL